MDMTPVLSKKAIQQIQVMKEIMSTSIMIKKKCFGLFGGTIFGDVLVVPI
jgi:hypothetical protein